MLRHAGDALRQFPHILLTGLDAQLHPVED